MIQEQRINWNEHGEFVDVVDPVTKTYLLFKFPDQKSKIAKLTLDQKLEWYAHQFQDPFESIVLLSSKEFEAFWKWRVLMPIKIKRFLYRLKNGELFKKYPHISEMKEKLKKHGI